MEASGVDELPDMNFFGDSDGEHPVFHQRPVDEDDAFYQDKKPRRPVYYRHPQQQRAHSTQANVQRSEPSTEEPLKEVRTYKRNGSELIEEYERLNPDGTVTKTVTVGDKNNGLKNYSVYKMDKSGIIRKIDNPDPDKYLPMTETEENYAWLDHLKRLEGERIKKRQQEQLDKIRRANIPYPKYGAYNPEEGQMIYYPDDKSTSLHHLSQLTQEQRDAVFNDYKEKVLHYGTKKLKKNLEKKLENDKRTKFTEEEKQKLIDYGVLKLQKLLEKNMNEQKNVLDFKIINKDDFPMPEEYLKPRKPPISFNIHQDNINTKSPNSADKNVSFGIRPEYKLNTSDAPKEFDKKKDTIFDRFKTFWKDNMYGNDKTTDIETKKAPKLETTDTDENDKIDETLNKLAKTLEKYLDNDTTYDDSPKNKKRKEDVVQYALNGMATILRDCQDKRKLKEMIGDANSSLGDSEIEELKNTKPKYKKEHLKKRHSSDDEYEEEYSDEYAKKLEKLLEKKKRHDKDNKHHKHDSKYRKITDNESESSDDKRNRKDDKKTKWWDWSSLFGSGDDEDKHKNDKKEKKELDFDTFLDKVRDTLSHDLHENAKKSSRSSDMLTYDIDLDGKKITKTLPEKSAQKGVEYDTLVAKIQNAQKEEKPVSYSSKVNNKPFNNEKDVKSGYKEKVSSQGVGHKSYIDTLLDKIRETMKVVPDDDSDSNTKNLRDLNNKYQSVSNKSINQPQQSDTGMSFHIKPQIFGGGKLNQPYQADKSSGKEKVTSNNGFVPWWFNQIPSSPTSTGDNMHDGFGNDLLNDSFFKTPRLN